MRLITGFPGFLGSEFMRRVLATSEDSFLALIQEKFRDAAERSLDSLKTAHPEVRSRVTLVYGDITEPGLGLTSSIDLGAIKTVDHFAALYDLNASEPLGKKINVDGTRNVLDFIRGLKNFEHLNYVSTCYVSGRFEGVFLESDLEKNQRFNNFYESTKYEAERLVRFEMSRGLSATIFRPAIVVGDSKSGFTQKFDGPYFVLQWLMRQGQHSILPSLGNPAHYRINLVPSDFVLDAMAYLSKKPESRGKTFHLADPAPLTIEEVIACFARALDQKVIKVPLPRGLAKFAVGAIPGLESWLGIPRSALDYFVHPTAYDVSETTRALQGSSIRCPPFDSYSRNLVTYRIENPGGRTRAMM